MDLTPFIQPISILIETIACFLGIAIAVQK